MSLLLLFRTIPDNANEWRGDGIYSVLVDIPGTDWTTTASNAETWASIAASTKDWTAQSREAVPPAWGQLSSIVTTVDAGVDFILEVHASYPILVSADRPVIVYDVQPEGRP